MNVLRILSIDRVAKLANLFVNFIEHVFGPPPVEADPRCLLRQTRGFEQGRQRLRYSCKHAFVFGLTLLILQFFPVHEHLFGVFGFDVAEDVRMPPNQLVVDRGDDVVDIKRSLFLRDLCYEHSLQEKVAELFRQCGTILTVDCVNHLIRLLDDERLEALQTLLSVPRTAVGSAQPHHQGNQLIKRALRHRPAL